MGAKLSRRFWSQKGHTYIDAKIYVLVSFYSLINQLLNKEFFWKNLNPLINYTNFCKVAFQKLRTRKL
jgi:hypothetical protein